MSDSTIAPERAYSVLNIRSFQEETRSFSGIASTPLPGRDDVILEPLGVRFNNPIPLLLLHNQGSVIGTVTLETPSADGIAFTARIPKVEEPGTLKTRTDEAWQLVKLGLMRGVSCGYRPDNPISKSIEFLKGGLVRILKSEFFELSLCAVPADIGASITAIRSFDPAAAAPGPLPWAQSPEPSGDTDPPRARRAPKAQRTMKTTTEQIAGFEATRAASSARMSEIMNTASEAGVTLDDAQTEEYDGLDEEVRKIDAHLVRLRALEATVRQAAAPVSGTDPTAAAASRAGRVISVRDNLPPGHEFVRYAMCLASARGNITQALEIAKSRYPDMTRIHSVLRSAVAAGTTTDPTWAGALVDYQNFAGDFVEYLRPQTIIGKFGTNGIPSLRRVPFNVQIMSQTSGGSGYWVGQGKPKPLTKFDFAPVRLGFAKVANIAVLTEETVRFSSPSAEALVREGLSKALIERLDTDFIDPGKTAVADVSPASITNNVSAGSSAGSDAGDVRADITTLLGGFIAANIDPTNLVWIMSSTNALAISLMRNSLGQREFPEITMRGGNLEGIPVIVSQYANLGGSPQGNILVLMSASDVYLSDDGGVTIDVSREASLEMDTAPSGSVATGSPLAPNAVQLVSLWQTNSVGLRAERFINWARRRDEAVAYLQDVRYSAATS